MDYACTVFPVTFVDPKLDLPVAPHDFHNHDDEAFYKLCMLLCIFSLSWIQPLCLTDHPDVFRGMPVGLQLIGRTLEEEAVIGMVELVDAAIKKHASGMRDIQG